MRDDRDFLPGENAQDRIYRILTEGIVYLFQYGYISEDKHFDMLDELNANYNKNGRMSNTGRKF